jgi:hypothetical protein
MKRTTLAMFLLATALGSDAGAQTPVPNDGREARFGMMGLARLQTARLSVVNHTTAAFVPPDPVRPPCRVRLGFVDDTGSPFARGDAAEIGGEFIVAHGQVVSLDLLAFDAFRGRTGNRVQFRPTVEFEPPDDTSSDPCAFAVPTLEIIAALTNRSLVVAGPFQLTEHLEAVGLGEPSERIIFRFGAVGLNRGQAVLVSVVNLSTGVWTLTVTITCGTETASGQATETVVPPTPISVSVQVTTCSALRPVIAAAAVLQPESAGPVQWSEIVPTFEIYDVLTGRTQVFLYPQQFTGPIRVLPGTE